MEYVKFIHIKFKLYNLFIVSSINKNPEKFKIKNLTFVFLYHFVHTKKKIFQYKDIPDENAKIRP